MDLFSIHCEFMSTTTSPSGIFPWTTWLSNDFYLSIDSMRRHRLFVHSQWAPGRFALYRPGWRALDRQYVNWQDHWAIGKGDTVRIQWLSMIRCTVRVNRCQRIRLRFYPTTAWFRHRSGCASEWYDSQLVELHSMHVPINTYRLRNDSRWSVEPTPTKFSRLNMTCSYSSWFGRKCADDRFGLILASIRYTLRLLSITKSNRIISKKLCWNLYCFSWNAKLVEKFD